MNYRARILAYHSISDCGIDPWAVSAHNFASQMQWLKTQGYTVLSLSQILEINSLWGIPRKSAVLTFDDGFADFFTDAMPILEKYKYPATLFIVAGRVGDSSRWQEIALQKPLLDWDVLIEVAGRGYQIGSHGMFHRRLTDLATKELEEELADSKMLLEARLGVKVDAFSYPWGSYEERERNAVKNVGYLSAVTVNNDWESGFKRDPFRIPRIAISRTDSPEDFKFKISGRTKLLSTINRIFNKHRKLV